jgi:glutamate racemase
VSIAAGSEPTSRAHDPLGVFDSGVGGLSVLREIRALLPAEDLLYIADSAHLPYGEKSPQFIESRALAITQFLVQQGAKIIVIACNTATSAAIATLRARFSVPIIGMEPAVKPALGHTRSGVVGVLATGGTLAGERFATLLARFGGDADVHVQPCAGLVELVEAGDTDSATARAAVQRCLAPLLARGADTLVLGCTHYPFLRPLIEQIAGPDVAIVDPSTAVAREVVRQLARIGQRAPAERRGATRFWTSAVAVAPVREVIGKLWGETEVTSLVGV